MYAVETSIQLALTELNENLRDIYLEAYSHTEASEYIYQHTSSELYRIFGPYLPSYTESDFYESQHYFHAGQPASAFKLREQRREECQQGEWQCECNRECQHRDHRRPELALGGFYKH